MQRNAMHSIHSVAWCMLARCKGSGELTPARCMPGLPRYQPLQALAHDEQLRVDLGLEARLALLALQQPDMMHCEPSVVRMQLQT